MKFYIVSQPGLVRKISTHCSTVLSFTSTSIGVCWLDKSEQLIVLNYCDFFKTTLLCYITVIIDVIGGLEPPVNNINIDENQVSLMKMLPSACDTSMVLEFRIQRH
jgi:hypothetical protein